MLVLMKSNASKLKPRMFVLYGFKQYNAMVEGPGDTSGKNMFSFVVVGNKLYPNFRKHRRQRRVDLCVPYETTNKII